MLDYVAGCFVRNIDVNLDRFARILKIIKEIDESKYQKIIEPVKNRNTCIARYANKLIDYAIEYKDTQV